MKYKLLSHLFYKNKDEYDALYQQRMSSESTVVLPIKIGDHNAFYCLCPEIYETSLRIMQLDKMVSVVEDDRVSMYLVLSIVLTRLVVLEFK